MHKHLSWILPEKFEQNLLMNSLPFQNKEIFFSIPQNQRLTIQFKVNADFASIGPQVLEFRFELKQNDKIIFTSPIIKRKFRNSSMNPFNQTLNIESDKVFNQTQDKYVVEIDVQELEPSGAPTPTLQKTISQNPSSIQPNPLSLSNKIDVEQINTPDHIFSPIRLKKEIIKLDNLDQPETNTSEPIPKENNIINIKSESIQVNSSITAIEPINSNAIILDSPVHNEKEEEEDSDDDISNSNSSTDSSTSFTSASTIFTEKKKKRKKKKLLSDIKLKLINKEVPTTDSQPIRELPKSLSLPFDSILDTNSPTISENQPNKKEESTETYCGLYNQGATCYMNSMLQAFYHLPEFRRLIYKMDTTIGNENEEDKEKSIKNNIPLQLQKLFATMQTTKESACSTRDLTRSFGWTDEDTIMQHDVQEFCRVLLDNLETKIDKQPQLKGSIQSLFRGKTRSFIRCTNVNYESKRDEYFYDLSLDVKGCRNLKESFFKYTENEKLTGKNQYDTGDPQFGKQDAVMGNEFIQFPPVLHLHLRRFEFNGNGMSKINSRFEFPLEINLGKFMAKDGEDRENQIFQLFGVLVHSGTVDGGHYYAFLRPTEKQKWYEFNDSSVSLSSLKDAIENNYGGSSNDNDINNFRITKSNNDKFHSMFKNHRFNMMQRHHNHNHHQSMQIQMHQNQQFHQRWFSAYMLIYIRKSEIPFLYRKVLDNEIPVEIRELIRQQEELKRKKEEQKRILENTINFHIFTFSDIGNHVSKTKKFCLPNVNDFSIGRKFTALRGEKFSVLYDKIMEDLEKESEKTNSFFKPNKQNVAFEFWQLFNITIGSKPIDLEKKIDFPPSQSLFLYFNDQKQEEENEEQNLNIYPFIIVFAFAYYNWLENPIYALKAIKINKNDTIRSLFDNIFITIGIQCKSVYKSTNLQTVEEIKNIDFTIEQNQIKNGSFLIFEVYETEEIEKEKQKIKTEIDIKMENSEIKRFTDAYKPDGIIEYLDVLKNMISFKIITTNSEILQNSLNEFQFFFPKNRNFISFTHFLRYALKIPEIKTLVFYESRSKKPLIYSKEQILNEKGKFDSLKVFQFDLISENVFQHSLLISFIITGSFTDMVDTTLNCWMDEDSTVADLSYYIENSFIVQLKLDYQNKIEKKSKDEIEAILNDNNRKQSIRNRVILNYFPNDGRNLRVYASKKDNILIYQHETKLAEVESKIYIDIECENQALIQAVIKEALDKKQKEQQNNTAIQNNEQRQEIENVIQQQQQQQQQDESALNPFFNSTFESDLNQQDQQQEQQQESVYQQQQQQKQPEIVQADIIIDDAVQSFPLSVFITEKAMNAICGFNEQGISIMNVFEGETILSLKRRLAYLLDKDIEFFIHNEKSKTFSFSLMLGNNSFMRVYPKDDELLSVYIKKGYTKLKVTMIMSEVAKTSFISHSSSKDDSVIIKN